MAWWGRGIFEVWYGRLGIFVWSRLPRMRRLSWGGMLAGWTVLEEYSGLGVLRKTFRDPEADRGIFFRAMSVTWG